MLRIAICDDNPGCVQSVQDGLEAWSLESGEEIQLDDFADGRYLLAQVAENEKYDIYFLDIEMQEVDGLKTAEILRENDYAATIIFISQSESYYKAAYEVLPFYFLSKPVEIEKIKSIMNRYQISLYGRGEQYQFCYGKEQLWVKLDHVLYFSSEKRYIRIVCKNEEFRFYGKLDQVEKEFEAKQTKFIRVHKSFFVNQQYIKQIGKTSITIMNQEIIPVSREFRGNVTKLHKQRLQDK